MELKCFESLAANEAIALHSRVSTTSQAIQEEATREAELQKRYQQLQEQKAELWQLLQQEGQGQ